MITKIHPLEIYNNVIRSKLKCFFCDPVNGSVLHETEHFRVIIDPFPVHAGHIMICSKNHVGSVKDMADEIFQELHQLKDIVEKKMRVIDGDSIFYEHGHAALVASRQHKHFHLHCLPVNISITDSLNQRFKGVLLNSYADIRSLATEFGDYLYFETTFGDKYFYPVKNDLIEGNLLRTLICNTLGITNRADWRTYQEAMTFVKSYELIENFIHWD